MINGVIAATTWNDEVWILSPNDIVHRVTFGHRDGLPMIETFDRMTIKQLAEWYEPLVCLQKQALERGVEK